MSGWHDIKIESKLLRCISTNTKIVLAVASLGIAANLLSGGRTAYPTFKLSLNIGNEDANLKHKQKQWPRCSFVTLQFNRLNRIYNDTQTRYRSAEPQPWGHPHQPGYWASYWEGYSGDKINASLKASPLWEKVEKLDLNTNMRVQLYNDQESGAFARKLLQIGEGLLHQIKVAK